MKGRRRACEVIAEDASYPSSGDLPLFCGNYVFVRKAAWDNGLAHSRAGRRRRRGRECRRFSKSLHGAPRLFSVNGLENRPHEDASMRPFNICWCAAALAPLAMSSAQAAIVVYDINNGGAAAFDAAVSGPTETINFDDLPVNTNLNGATMSGMTFNAPIDGAPLLVVDASTTFTPAGFTGTVDESLNKLPATTGLNILSPGGPELGPGLNNAVENDDLELVFQPGIVAFAFDHLSQSGDGFSFTTIEIYDQVNDLLFSGTVAISDGGLGGAGTADFWGFVADGGEVIRRIVFDELDNNAEFPDSNIGYDSLRFQVAPEPASATAGGAAGAALLAARRMARRRPAGGGRRTAV